MSALWRALSNVRIVYTLVSFKSIGDRNPEVFGCIFGHMTSLLKKERKKEKKRNKEKKKEITVSKNNRFIWKPQR